MDSGWIVAGSSLATIIATGFFNIRTKRIEAEHKINEHKMSIRNTYVLKKIEAGQKIIGENNIRLSNRYYIKMYLLALRDHKRDYEDIILNHKVVEDKLIESGSDINNFAALYYNTEELYFQSGILLDKINELLPLIEPSSIYCQNEGYSENVNNAIEYVDKLIATYHAINQEIRIDLAKYDIL